MRGQVSAPSSLPRPGAGYRPISGYRPGSGYRPISGYRWASGCCPVSGCRPRDPDIRIPADIRISASNPYPPKSGCDGGLADGYPYPYPSRISGFPYPAESSNTHTPDTGHWSEVSKVPTIRSRGATSLGHHHQLQRIRSWVSQLST